MTIQRKASRRLATQGLSSWLGLLAVAFSVCACTTPGSDGDALDAEEFDHTQEQLNWNDLLGGDQWGAKDLAPTNAILALYKRTSGENNSPESDGSYRGIESHQGLARSVLAPTMDHQMRLVNLALTHCPHAPQFYEKGVLCKRGSARIFVATTDRIPNAHRLYWVMVKVLSEKYGCFMTTKQTWRWVTKVTCRDRRQIVFHTSEGDGWVRFVVRQFDREGYEIEVRKRQIVRLSDQRVLR